MGLLTLGTPLSWEDTKKWSDHVRKHGIQQLINIYRRLKDRHGDVLKWGDEMEYMLVVMDEDTKTARLSLNANEVLEILEKREKESPRDYPASWHPEHGAFMLEGTPIRPYGHLMEHLNMVEANMRLRREEILSVLDQKRGETVLTLTSFPRHGCPGFTDPEVECNPTVNPESRSLFFPDAAISIHPRFRNFVRNIRERRGEKVSVNIPVFKDSNTPKPFKETFPIDDVEANRNAKDDHIYMDYTAFGLACVQCTLQASDLGEALRLYDQLAPLCPIFLALSAAAPVHRGYLADTDCRCNIISQSVDCRTREERGLEPLKHDKFVIPKSRYDSIDCYLTPEAEKYNDIDLVLDQDICQQLQDAGMGRSLARHFAHLFIRDPISLFSEKIHQNDELETDHFEAIQTTNWQPLRFKPPPPNSTIGWRVEFRPMEIQLTDFENAAYVVFIVLLTRVILFYNLNFLIPMSKVDENMQEAQKRDAVRQGLFWFRKEVLPPYKSGLAAGSDSQCNGGWKEDDKEYTKMTINEIINGKAGGFQGLVSLMNSYLETVDIDVDTRCSVQQYLRLIQKRASGELMTTARWIRSFVQNHPKYKSDSVVSEEITYDLTKVADEITKGVRACPELFGTPRTRSKVSLSSEGQKKLRKETPGKADIDVLI
ncbi:PREDICTED: glutamate--cysteine ligase catalytic subunit-like [Branchiostoma belcheri]|uniref:Glutamate--cysteine ligase n=1 Tax=Branchiostoma belcheri TaxID=7741 RepID=A0A6P4YH06_BRABE|nr:PREDICTED: glutamate--cysteine ligase catalytic subunit-like [Branchiostoma belcheri]